MNLSLEMYYLRLRKVKKLPKKTFLLYYEENIDSLITSVAKQYNVKKSAIIEEMILSFLDPDKFLILLTIIQNDDFYKKQVEEYLLEG